jgi:hypothetical protein
MTIYEEYAKAKEQVKLLTQRLKEIEPQIVEEIKNLSAPMKTDYGMFSKVQRVSWSYPTATLERSVAVTKRIEEFSKPLLQEIDDMKKVDIETGKAVQTVDVGLRFTENKEAK